MTRVPGQLRYDYAAPSDCDPCARCLDSGPPSECLGCGEVERGHMDGAPHTECRFLDGTPVPAGDPDSTWMDVECDDCREWVAS